MTQDKQRAAMIRPRGKSEAPHMIAAYRAMQMALDVLEALKNTNSYWWQEVHESDLNNMDKAITALREALSAESTETCSASAQPQGEWVDLTDDEIAEVLDTGVEQIAYSGDLNKCLDVIAKFKSKNTPPVVPQVVTEGNASEVRSTDTGEPVGEVNELGVIQQFDYTLRGGTFIYTTPPSSQRADALVEAAIEATKEKAAKVCEKIGKTIEYDRPNKDLGDAAFDCAAAIRSMK